MQREKSHIILKWISGIRKKSLYYPNNERVRYKKKYISSLQWTSGIKIWKYKMPLTPITSKQSQQGPQYRTCSQWAAQSSFWNESTRLTKKKERTCKSINYRTFSPRLLNFNTGSIYRSRSISQPKSISWPESISRPRNISQPWSIS